MHRVCCLCNSSAASAPLGLGAPQESSEQEEVRAMAATALALLILGALILVFGICMLNKSISAPVLPTGMGLVYYHVAGVPAVMVAMGLISASALFVCSDSLRYCLDTRPLA